MAVLERSITRRFDYTVDVPLLMSHPKSALLGVLQLLDGWQNVIEDDITVEQFSGAMTNMVYRCGLLQGGKEVQVVLMRVHASASELFDRQLEIDTFRGVSKAGLGPQLLMLFTNGRVEEFLGQHVTLAASDIHDPAVSTAIAATLATFHNKMSKAMASEDEPGAVQLWERLRSWLDQVQQVTSLSELQELGMADLEAEIAALEQRLSQQHPCWIALCHNDLQYGNIMARLGAPSAGPSADGSAAAAAAAAAAAVPAAAEGSAAGQGGNGSSSSTQDNSSLTQQLKSLEIQDSSKAAAAAAAAAAGAGVLGSSPREQQLQQLVGKPESNLSDDTQSLSNVSVAGSTAPSVCGLSAYSASTATSISTAAATRAAQSAAAAPAAAAAGGGSVSTAANAKPQLGSGPSVTASSSASSLQVLGRSPHRSVQLPDGSLVLPGMRARPRGQSPEPVRGKRPDLHGGSFTGSLGGASREGSGVWGIGSEAGGGSVTGGGLGGLGGLGSSTAAGSGSAAGGGHSTSRLGVPQLQAPSAAAVLRHATSDEGELLLQLMPEDPDGVAGVGVTRRRTLSRDAHGATAGKSSHRGGGNSSGTESEDSSSSSSLSAAESAEGAGLLLMPQHLRPCRRQEQQQRQLGLGMAGELAVQRPAGTGRTGRKYREGRRARLQPADGLQFPTLITSDPEDGDDFDSDSDLSADVTNESSAARGRSPPSRFQHPAGGAASPSAAPAAAAAGAAAAVVTSPVAAAVTAASADDADSSSCITFIDYEYSGFNPVAYDIANHWCEWAADYHTEEPHVLNFSKLPEPQQQYLFVEAYLRALLTKAGIQVPLTTAAAGAGTTVGRSSISGTPVASPEPANLSALAGYSLTVSGMNPGRSEPAWSTLSSRGGSVLSFPETDAGWETASQSSVMTAKSHRTEAEEAAAAAADGHAAAADDGSSLGPVPSSSSLCDIWCWLEYVTGVSKDTVCSGGQQLSAAAFQQLVSRTVAAAEAYMAASHLLWALWGVIQAKVSDVDFDFTGYGQQRWKMYLQSRPALLHKDQ